MDGTHDDSSQWEQSKENIQPLKQGRKATVLSVVLDDNAAQKLNIIRHEFEEELRTYSGDDPLDVWYRYVLWVEQNYPKGGKEGKLTKLIEKCLMAMYGNADVREKYVNDERFLDIWIRYANLSTNPLEIYQTMEAKSLCLSLADYYINWAWEMEKTGSYKRADAIYEKGLQAGAKPLCNLQESHKKFQIRVSRSTIEGRMGDQEINSSEQERVALSALKSQGHRVGVNRSGPALAGPAGRCFQDLPSKTNGPAFSIFKDTSTQGVTSDLPSDDQSTLGLGASANRENIRKPNQWSKSKVKQKAVNVVPVEDVDKYHKPEFSVHEDENASQYSENHTRLSTASHVLAQHKEEYDSWHVQLFIPEPFDPKAQPQYCKHKVYCGTEEFSFEELRAARYTKSQKEQKEKESELQQMRDMLKKQEEMIQKLLKHQSEEQEDKSLKPVAPPNPPPSSQPKVSHQKARKELKSSIIYQDSWLAINKSVNASINASNLHDESANILFQSEPPVTAGYGKESVSNDPVPPVVINEQGSLSTSGNSRGLSFTDPTGDAANIIDDMWSATLSHSISHHSGDTGARLSEPPSSENLAPIYEDDCKKNEAPSSFQIFSDPVSQNQKTEPCGMPQLTRVLKEKSAAVEAAAAATKAADVAPTLSEINVQEPTSSDAGTYPEVQDENCPPAGMILLPHETRHISGVLQPAKYIPVPQDQETQDVKSVEIEERNFEYRQANDIEPLYVSTMKNEDLDDIVPLDDKQMEDFTIKMPNNEAIFSHMAKVASTPVPWSQGYLAHSSTSRNDFTIATDTDKHFPLIQEEKKSYSLLKNNNQEDIMPPPSTTKAQIHANVTTTTTTTSLPYAESEAGLSVIMEASREYRSSSSSSGCTTSNTLPSHSVHGSSHPGNFSLSTVHVSRVRHQSQPDEEMACESAPAVQVGDFTKSGYLADKSRGESLAESLPYTTGAAQPKNEGHSMSICSTAAKMMMDFDGMMLSCSDLKGEKCVSSRNINPFDEEVIENILSNLEVPLTKRGGYVAIRKDIPCFKPGLQVTLGRECFHIYKMCGEGAYAKVYRAITMDPLNVTMMPSDDDEDEEHQVILKVQKPACPWEFYICHELRQRLKASMYSEGILNSIMKSDRGYFFSSGSVLVNQYHAFGTLLDVVNKYRAIGKTMPEDIAMFFMIEILSILEAVHNCNIIHADIKPDNFLVQAIPESNTSDDIFTEGPTCLKLIDFGRSIDMKAFPEGTTFTEVVTTEKFTCCEMRDGRPWTYQTDYFGAAAIAHLFLFGTYMDLKKTKSGKWDIMGVFKRYWKKNLWENIFSTLLNVPSCSALPNLSALRSKIITTFYEERMHKDIYFKFHTLQQMEVAQK
ncbi:uncharacterized protein LOC135112755 [Scylla paramamosain]|uniref:uncharacterized protein LOC135112755 n=1 Tax=Scylla paramamosain TaxID=85552 RepID=UPI0030831A5D